MRAGQAQRHDMHETPEFLSDTAFLLQVCQINARPPPLLSWCECSGPAKNGAVAGGEGRPESAAQALTPRRRWLGGAATAGRAQKAPAATACHSSMGALPAYWGSPARSLLRRQRFAPDEWMCAFKTAPTNLRLRAAVWAVQAVQAVRAVRALQTVRLAPLAVWLANGWTCQSHFCSWRRRWGLGRAIIQNMPVMGLHWSASEMCSTAAVAAVAPATKRSP